MQIAAVAMIIVGLTAAAWGLPAAHRLRKPWDSMAALLVLAGVVAALIGAVLVMIPNFFG